MVLASSGAAKSVQHLEKERLFLEQVWFIGMDTLILSLRAQFLSEQFVSCTTQKKKVIPSLFFLCNQQTGEHVDLEQSFSTFNVHTNHLRALIQGQSRINRAESLHFFQAWLLVWVTRSLSMVNCPSSHPSFTSLWLWVTETLLNFRISNSSF